MTLSMTLADHIRSRSGEYFADLSGDQVRILLRRVSRRGNSTLQEFVLGGDSSRHVILVKTPSRHLSSPLATSSDGRPRIFPPVSPEVKGRFEYQAMSAIESNVERLNDPRFGAVRILDLFTELQAIVMEKASERSLNRLLLKGAIVSLTPQTQRLLAQAVRNSGSWLRYYHSLPGLTHTQVRSSDRSAFVDSIQLLIDYLSQFHQREDFEGLGHELTRLSREILPDKLPLGLGHGDYAPRNVLLASTGKIRVIDTLSRWIAPVYEDVACFLTHLKTSRPQVWSWGRANRSPSLELLEQQFLGEYFAGEQIPLAPIRLFECQCLLERWAASNDRIQRMRPLRRKVRWIPGKWWEAFMHKRLQEAIEDVYTTAAQNRRLSHPR